MKNHVVFQPETHTGMQDGIRQLAKTIRPTLGPLPRNVAIMPIEPKSQNKAPEILDSAGTIARRIYEISGRSENTGAMFLRQMIWKQYEEQGDGAATAVVLFQCLYDQGIKYVTAGGNAMILRKYLENGMRIVLNQLQADAELIRDRKTMQQLAQSLVNDQALAEALGEIVDIIGPDAPVEIRSGRSRLVEREYIPGIIYPGGYHSAVYFEDMRDGRIQLENPAVA
jgi:chaperonin GroEL